MTDFSSGFSTSIAMRRVFGTVLLPGVAPVTTAQVTVEVLDVSRPDALSQRLAIQRQVVAIGPNEAVGYDLWAPEADERASLTLRAHVDVDASEDVTVGDLVTTASIPVPPRGDHGPIVIEVQPVG